MSQRTNCEQPGAGSLTRNLTLTSPRPDASTGSSTRVGKAEEDAMKDEKLEELQREINAQRSLKIEDCAALLSEVWRLKIAATGKTIEVDYRRDRCNEVKAELSRVKKENDRLRSEIDLLKAVNNLATCELECRWSNCAVGLRKRQRRSPVHALSAR